MLLAAEMLQSTYLMSSLLSFILWLETEIAPFHISFIPAMRTTQPPEVYSGHRAFFLRG